MVPSDPANSSRRGQRRSPARVLLVALLVVVLAVAGWRAVQFLSLTTHFGNGFDEGRFDQLEDDFDRDRPEFVAAETRMQELVEAHPGAVRIGWSLSLICVSDGGLIDVANDCTETGPADQAIFAALPNANVVVHQSKDAGRTFFRFFQDDPLRYTVMYAPRDAHPKRFADDRGFRSTRALEGDWTLLGPIPDADREDKQWLG